MLISVIICSREANKIERSAQMYRQLLGTEPVEIVHIPDAKGLAEGYNRGLAQSKGEVIVFSHDDIYILAPDFRSRLLGHLEQADLLGVAGTNRLMDGNWFSSGPPFIYGQVAHVVPQTRMLEVSIYSAPSRRIGGMQAMDGLFLCCRRELAEAVRFDEQTFRGFHLYDIDFTFRAHRAGYRLAVCADFDVIHDSSGSYDQNWQQEFQRFVAKHSGALAPPIRRRFDWTRVLAATPQEAAEIMRPTHWPSAECSVLSASANRENVGAQHLP